MNGFLCFHDLIGDVCSGLEALWTDKRSCIRKFSQKPQRGSLHWTEQKKKKKIVTEEGLNIWLCIIENKRVHDSLNWD